MDDVNIVIRQSDMEILTIIGVVVLLLIIFTSGGILGWIFEGIGSVFELLFEGWGVLFACNRVDYLNLTVPNGIRVMRKELFEFLRIL